jgi:hypothetical protein
LTPILGAKRSAQAETAYGRDFAVVMAQTMPATMF